MSEILFLAHRLPWPPDRGDKIRSHWELKKLAQIAPVHVATFTEDDRDESFISDMAAICASHYSERRTKSMIRAGTEALLLGEPVSLTAFRSRRVQAYINALLAERPIDRIFVFSGQMAAYLPDDFAGRIFMDFGDVDSAKFESYARGGNLAMRWVNKREGQKLAHFEHDIARKVDMSLFVSDAEAALFQQRSGLTSARIKPLCNGIDHVFFNPAAPFAKLSEAERPKGPLMVFTGQMDYRPNIEAVSDFARRILPDIRAQLPEATFAIVGRAPTPAVQALAKEAGVIVTGAVDDVRSWLAAADLIVAPLRIARGIQNKVLEAMAMERPVLASALAAEGIDAEDGTHFIVAQTPEDEARLALELLGNPVKSALLGTAARAHVIARYGWDAQLSVLDDWLGDMHKQGGGA